MKKTNRKLSLSKESIRLLVASDLRMRGGQPTGPDPDSDFCGTTSCHTYKEITCASELYSCLTNSGYCC